MINDTRLPSLVKTTVVSLSVDAAFRRFTEDIASWWPLDTHSVGGEEAESVAFGRASGEPITERVSGGKTHVWGTILAWEPPTLVRFTWHPGREPNDDQEVAVRFRATARGTEVTLTHTGWESFGDDAETMRSRYDEGWGFVLAQYAPSA